MMRRVEERERRRRLANNEECIARKVNAGKMSDTIRTESTIIRGNVIPPHNTLRAIGHYY